MARPLEMSNSDGSEARMEKRAESDARNALSSQTQCALCLACAKHVCGSTQGRATTE
jgi:hypothetical protein